MRKTKEEIDALAEAVLPHLRDAVMAQIENWHAEGAIEAELGFDVDGLHDAYVHLVVCLDTPEQITLKEARELVEYALAHRDGEDEG